MKTVLFTLVFLISYVYADDKYCPPLSDTGPCYCRHGFFYDVTGTRVSCRGINNTEVLYNEIQKFRNYPIDLLILTDLNLPFFKAGLFSGTSVRNIVIWLSSIENLYDVHHSNPSPFDGLGESLQELTLKNTQGASNWYWPDMSNLKQLKTITFTESPIRFVGHVLSEIGEGSLETINVQYSSVYRVHPQAFPSLTNLKEVSLRGNYIPYMVRTMFSDPAPQLRTIDLRNNLLFNLPENMFSNMEALRFVDVSRNKFLEIQEVVYAPIWNSITDLYLADNPLKCDCYLLWLYKKIESGFVPKYNDFQFLTCESEVEGGIVPLNQASKDLQCQ